MYSWPLYDFEFDIPSMKNLIANYDIYYGHTSAMPLDLSQVFTKQGVRTFIMSPVYRDNAKVGLVGADFCERERDDCEIIAPIFRHLAGLVAMALEKKQHQLLLSKVSALRSIIHEIEPMLRGHELEEFNQAAKATKPITLLDAERRIIIETLELYKGNKLKTAKHLGLT
ncbi:MAG: helix-turn-helix domain-containing protein [Planctomycetes bacterium]|nr:helix-turn-helix domain-containing protein [Planctomycetota bacterium]